MHGHWYFEDIKYNHLQEFLKQNDIHWNQMAHTNESTLVMPENVAEIAKNSHNYELYLLYQGLADFFNYEIDEEGFILMNRHNDININLSKNWQAFLEEFKKENQIEDAFNV